MSAFGHAGFGSRGRQNQLRAQGQMDPYGNQVRQAKQAPTFNVYSQQSQTAPSSRPATPRPQPASMPAYGGQPQTGGPMPTMGQAQPIQSAGGGTSSQQGGQIPTYDDWMRGQPQTGGPTPTSPGVTQPSTPPSQPQTGGPFPTYGDWMSGQGSSNYVNPPTGGPFPTYDSVMGPQTGGPMPTMGQAQPIPPASAGTSPGGAPDPWLRSRSTADIQTDLTQLQRSREWANDQRIPGQMAALQAELAGRGVTFDASDARRKELQGNLDSVNKQIQQWNDRAAPGSPRIGETFLVDGRPDQMWMQANEYWETSRRDAQKRLDDYNAANPVIMTGGPGVMRTPGVNAPPDDDNPAIMTGGPAQLWNPGVNAPPATGGPMPTMGQAQPIPPASTGTPYAQAQSPQPYAGPPRDLEPLGGAASVDPRTDAGFAKWSGYQPGQARTPAIERMEKAAVDQWKKWTPAQRAAASAGVGQQRHSPEYATQLGAAYGDAQKQQESTARFNEIQGLRRQLAGGTSAQDDDILYRLNTLEGGQQISREDFLKKRQAERDDAPRAAQYKDREKFIDEWMQEQRRANMSPAEYQQSRQRTREFDKPLGAIQNDPYTNPLGLGRPYDYDAEMRRRFLASQAQLRSDMASQEQFLAGWQGTRPFEEWYSQRYGGDAKQKWSLL